MFVLRNSRGTSKVACFFYNNNNNNISLYYYLNLNINNSKYMSGSSAYNKVTEVNPQLASALYQYVFEYYLPLSLEYVE